MPLSIIIIYNKLQYFKENLVILVQLSVILCSDCYTVNDTEWRAPMIQNRYLGRNFLAVGIAFLLGVTACGQDREIAVVEMEVETMVEPSLRPEGEETTAELGATEEPAQPLTTAERMGGRTKVKGIYVTGPRAGSEGMEDLIRLVDETELNAMVIDVKNDEGNITFRLTNEEIARNIPVLDQISEMGAGVRYIRDIQALMQKLKEHDIYTIARIVCFKDPCLAEARPELALTKPDGEPVTDANGLAWVNPYQQEVWEYLTELAEMAADLGFDEIQYDYVRFPVGSDADAADYGVDMCTYPKQQAIQDFLSYAGERLHEKECVITADVFGTIIGSETDVQTVGQNYTVLGQTVDVISPMVYPSHYGNGVFGLKVPDANPYETVLAAMQGSREALQEIPEAERAVVRPWLQAFTATWVQGHISYNGTQIREQIQAVYDAGYVEWILWNATNRYSAEGLLGAEETVDSSADQPVAE